MEIHGIYSSMLSYKPAFLGNFWEYMELSGSCENIAFVLKVEICNRNSEKRALKRNLEPLATAPQVLKSLNPREA